MRSDRRISVCARTLRNDVLLVGAARGSAASVSNRPVSAHRGDNGGYRVADSTAADVNIAAAVLSVEMHSSRCFESTGSPPWNNIGVGLQSLMVVLSQHLP
jgi:hypothetical protein